MRGGSGNGAEGGRDGAGRNWHECEQALRQAFRERTRGDFVVLEEVWGRHAQPKGSVRADLLCHATPALQARGFPRGWFVVETKHMDFLRQPADRLYDTLGQAVSYGNSEFWVDGEWVRPLFATMLINAQQGPVAHPAFKAQKRRWAEVLEMGARLGTGHIQFYGGTAWGVKFGRGLFYHSHGGPGPGMWQLPHGLVRRVGSRYLHVADGRRCI